MKKMIQLNNHTEIEAGLAGNPQRKVVMLPIAKKSVYGPEAESLKQWGVDPQLGEHFVEGLAEQFRVLYFDYEGHLFQYPEPDRLTAEHIVRDFLQIADEMGVHRFSYYGYSWLGLMGLQLALRTDRLESLMMGGYPPYEGPYREMTIVTEKTYELAWKSSQEVFASAEGCPGPDDMDWEEIPVTIDPRIPRQFQSLYRSLNGFDDRLVQARLTIPRLAFAGSGDTLVYGEKFGNVTVDIGGILQRNCSLLESMGWDIEILQGDGMDHTKAMQPAAVLPLIKPWLMKSLKYIS
ncbi:MULTISPECIES: alpha/beta hydrolase [Paenibacillus]|uniref:alpha/beta fold hydrolase n=1 Tax=Paenibacillus TaxID=44249 RepID=UPI002FE18023